MWRRLLAVVIACFAGCGIDDAERAYRAALRGHEDGSSYEERIALLDRAIALAPGRARYFESRAVLRVDTREFAAAVQDLDEAVGIADRPYLRFLRGLALCQNGDCTDALSDFDEAIAAQPENAQFYRGRALALVSLGQADAAAGNAERLVELAPQDGRSYYVRGVVRAVSGRHEEAVSDFEEALRRMPELVYPITARAESYEALGAPERASADRAAAARAARDACAYCLDPFRY